MPVDFREYFWGENNNGFDVLYHNMKYGYLASKDLADFFRERSSVEENHSKLLSKLAKQAGNGCAQGTFAPLWQVLKASSEKLATLHMQMVQRFQELVKEVHKYCDEQHKRHKQVKEEESGTMEVVQSIQHTISSLQKAKVAYNVRCLEYEKLKRENASPKDVEKAEQKCKKACDDYKGYIEKYSNVKEDFEKKMTVSCQHFQQIEEAHLKQMKEFLSSYAQVLESGHALIGQVHIEFRQQCNNMEIDKLLEQFAKSRGTGPEKPGPIVFEEADMSSLAHLPAQDSVEVSSDDKPNKKEGHEATRTACTTSLSPSISVTRPKDSPVSSPVDIPTKSDFFSRTTSRASKFGQGSFPSDWHAYWNSWSAGFLSRRKKEKRNKKKEENKEPYTSADGESKDSTGSTGSPTPVVDEEGYIIRPQEDERKDDNENFYSSSDSETEEEEKEKKIYVEIKPITNGPPMSGSVDELRASVGNISLSPIQHSNRRVYSSATSTPEDGPIKRSASATHPISKDDVFSVFSPSASSASTPTGVVGGMQSPTNSLTASTEGTPVTANRYAALSEIFAEATQNETSSLDENAKPALSISRGSTPTGSIALPALPRPPSRRAVEAPRGRMSPLLGSSITRTESVGSLTSDFKVTTMSVSSSRGPSPLTIGMCDTIPLAVAFQESVSAYFKGSDEAKCQVQLVGNMKVAFPAGIVQVLANNPSPATLSFRLLRTSKIENVRLHKEIISEETAQVFPDHHIYEFNMPALTAFLRRRFEETPNASYYNVDILKYQVKASPGAKNTPLHLVSYWKCEPLITGLRVDYKYNPKALSTMVPITNIVISVPVNGGVSDMQSKPPGSWATESQTATWRITELSHHSDGGGMGSLRARFDLGSGPSTPSTVTAQFNCHGTLLSGLDFELVGLGYRLSLVRRQVLSGTYKCDAD